MEPRQSNKSPILILTTAFGEGHNAAAKNLKIALNSMDPDRQVEIRDLFAEAYGPLYRVVRRGYFLFINYFPDLWRAFYHYLDRNKEARKKVAVYKRALRLLSRTVTSMRPSVIVSVYPGYNHLLDYLHQQISRPFHTVTVVTDSISINSIWHTGHSDLYLVPNEETAQVMEKAGVPSDLLHVSGFPVPPVFAELRRRREAPEPGHPPKVFYMANPGQRNAVEILRQLGEVEGIELTAACGRDEELRRELSRVAASFKKPIRVEGWMPDLPERIATSHLVVAKAGGATVQECLAAGTPLVMSQIIPGQEEGNAELLTKNDCGCVATTPSSVATAVRHAFSRGGAVWKTWAANALRTGTPEGAACAAREVLAQAELRS